ncbi:MAG TPA: aminotransferase class III-fold pyridoxal phosphate-dependent enzyme [Clostridiales bacterium]|nr:aminotransferase class III-fold pyridoxal phosphate-dependent enzyme [Clostridiales bacterium]
MTEFEKYFIPVYKRIEKRITGSKGCYLITEDGKYLDMFGGLGVNALGYNVSNVNNAIEAQLERFSHLSNYFEAEPVGKLAEYLVNNTFAEKVFFTNSGTEAIEAGMKLIRKYGKANGKNTIITFSQAFHGRTLAAASVTAPDNSSPYNFPGGVPNVMTLKFNDTGDLDKINGDTAGVFVEFIQGQGGVNVADGEFARKLSERTAKFKAVLMADEIQSGMGRTGKLFSFEHFGIVPDIAVTAKAIGGGLPLGVLMAGREHCDILGYGEHGSTFGGNPVSCAAGLETIKTINRKTFLENVSKKGGMLVDEAVELRNKHPELIGRISGLGLMIGIEILRNENKISELFQKEKIFVNMTQGNILRLLPPLIINEGEIELFISAFSKILKNI